MTETERIAEFINISKKVFDDRGIKDGWWLSRHIKGESDEDVKKANDLIVDLKNTPHVFVLACIVNSGLKGEHVVMIPYKVMAAFHKLGLIKNYSINELANVKIDKYDYVFTQYYDTILHRYKHKMAKYLYDAVQHIKNEYNSDASNIWKDIPSSQEVVERFREFNGMGQKISTMTANLLLRDFKIKFSDYSKIDISLDTHIIHVMKRLGFIKFDGNEYDFKKNIILKTREFNPEYPGLFDSACFDAGKYHCKKDQNPDCNNCLFCNICKKII
jgi:endonuclease III